MEKIVIIHNVTDGCSYSFTDTIPLEYSSAEALLCDFADWIAECIDKVAGTQNYPTGEFKVGSYGFYCNDCCYMIDKMAGDRSKDHKWAIALPEVYTLDEWFEATKET
jgi:hypothetical protein